MLVRAGEDGVVVCDSARLGRLGDGEGETTFED